MVKTGLELYYECPFLLPISLQLNRCEYMYSLWLYCFRSLIIGLLSKFDLFYVFGVMICVYFFSFFFIDYTLVVTVGILKPIAVVFTKIFQIGYWELYWILFNWDCIKICDKCYLWLYVIFVLFLNRVYLHFVDIIASSAEEFIGFLFYQILIA